MRPHDRMLASGERCDAVKEQAGRAAPHRDIAVLQLANASGLQTVKRGGAIPLHVGMRIVARGNAQGRGGPPKTARDSAARCSKSCKRAPIRRSNCSPRSASG